MTITDHGSGLAIFSCISRVAFFVSSTLRYLFFYSVSIAPCDVSFYTIVHHTTPFYRTPLFISNLTSHRACLFVVVSNNDHARWFYLICSGNMGNTRLNDHESRNTVPGGLSPNPRPSQPSRGHKLKERCIPALHRKIICAVRDASQDACTSTFIINYNCNPHCHFRQAPKKKRKKGTFPPELII